MDYKGKDVIIGLKTLPGRGWREDGGQVSGSVFLIGFLEGVD